MRNAFHNFLCVCVLGSSLHRTGEPSNHNPFNRKFVWRECGVYMFSMSETHFTVTFHVLHVDVEARRLVVVVDVV